MEINGDPTGFISHCVSELIKVGFDASAITIAKWAGVALLVAIFLAAALTFFSRLRHGKDILPFLSDIHFRLILLAALLLITFPMIAKVANDTFDVTLASADRDFAQRICQDSLDVTAGTAQAEALMARVDMLEETLLNMQGSGNGQETAEVVELAQGLIGQAVTIFYIAGRAEDAVRIEDQLRAAGAGVATRQSDLSETLVTGPPMAGATHILYARSAEQHVSEIEAVLAETDIPSTQTHGPLALRGSAIQMLLF